MEVKSCYIVQAGLELAMLGGGGRRSRSPRLPCLSSKFKANFTHAATKQVRPGSIGLQLQLFRRLRQEDHKFKARPGNLVRPYLQIKKCRELWVQLNRSSFA